MKKLGSLVALAAGLTLLSACFMSATSLISPQDAVLPVDGPMTACLSDTDPCIELTRRGDGYFAISPEDENESITLRFTPLAQAGQKQVFVAEVEMNEGDETAFIYGVMRRRDQPDGRGATIDVAPLDCDDMDETQDTAFTSAGGEIEVGKIKSCMPASLAQLKATILDMHGEDIAQDTWWVERASEF